HDRYMLDRLSTIVLGLDGQGGAAVFADYAQWELWQKDRKTAVRALPRPALPVQPSQLAPAQPKSKLSYMEAREYATIEHRISQAEQVLQSRRAELEDPDIASDGPKLLAAQAGVGAAQKNLDDLYERWAKLEEKASSFPASRNR
ncbi:MAG TPA: ABC transporter C-terminal domain-containing protein, partial [Candidatus Sulfotelmatobacter sp.]|nr:ABC transporter C-terminal domain-containing protein [Candidatus Sulfotelmatobacter sp.]